MQQVEARSSVIMAAPTPLIVAISSVPLPASTAAPATWAAARIPVPIAGLPARSVGTILTQQDLIDVTQCVSGMQRAHNCSTALVTDAELAHALQVQAVTHAEFGGFGPSRAAPGVAALANRLQWVETQLNVMSHNARAEAKNRVAFSPGHQGMIHARAKVQQGAMVGPSHMACPYSPHRSSISLKFESK